MPATETMTAVTSKSTAPSQPRLLRGKEMTRDKKSYGGANSSMAQFLPGATQDAKAANKSSVLTIFRQRKFNR